MTGNPIRQQKLERIVPIAAAVIFTLLFVRLGFWQLDRAAEKIAATNAFESPASYADIVDAREPAQFEPVQAYGDYIEETQILIDNIVVNGRIGYYVVTPFSYGIDFPLLLVNRGWIPKQDALLVLAEQPLAVEPLTIRGKSGVLPRVAIRPDVAFEPQTDWPRTAVYPTFTDVAEQLDHPVLPDILLLDPDQPHGFHRDWRPRQSGPSTNYGYAFQWFAMAAAIIGLAGWHWRKKRVAANER